MAKEEQMKRLVLALILGISLYGCGGGGGDGDGGSPAVTPPNEDLTGTYSLTAFTVKFSDGTIVDQNSSTITSWSGTMKIGDTTFTQSFVINDTPIALTGTATITWTSSTTGIAHVTEQSGLEHDVYFSISGNDLTTYSGIIQSGTPGLTFEEWDYWLKVSDTLEILKRPEELEKEAEKIIHRPKWIGEILNP
jgi:hypothetical protein